MQRSDLPSPETPGRVQRWGNLHHEVRKKHIRTLPEILPALAWDALTRYRRDVWGTSSARAMIRKRTLRAYSFCVVAQ